jgi:flagellar motility protein MotE (MotC chaperone)
MTAGPRVAWLAGALAAAAAIAAGCANANRDGDGGPEPDRRDADRADARPANTDAGDAAPASDARPAASDAGDAEASCNPAQALVEALRQRERELELQARSLEEREQALQQYEKALADRLASLEKTQSLAKTEVERLDDVRAGRCREAEASCEQKIAALRVEYGELERGLAQWDDAQKRQSDEVLGAELERLSKALARMSPEKAAATLSAMDRDTAALLLGRIPDRQTGPILAALAPDKTVSIVGALLDRSKTASRDDLRAAGASPAANEGAP